MCKEVGERGEWGRGERGEEVKGGKGERERESSFMYMYSITISKPIQGIYMYNVLHVHVLVTTHHTQVTTIPCITDYVHVHVYTCIPSLGV